MTNVKVIVVALVALGLLPACIHGTEPSRRGAAAPVLSRILQKGELVVGTVGSMPPLNMTTEAGKIIGFEADLAQEMATGMGVELKLVAMPFAQLLPGLESGDVDMVLSGMTITPERNLRVAFVGPYFVSGKAFLTKIATIASAKDVSEVNTPDTTLTALRGSTSQFFVEQAIPKAKLVLTQDYDEAVNMVLQDKADALVADYPICVVSALRYPGKGLVSVFTRLTYEPIGIAVPANDLLLVNWVENFLNVLERSGQLQELKSRWCYDGSWLNEFETIP